jgi:hypothetical protein
MDIHLPRTSKQIDGPNSRPQNAKLFRFHAGGRLRAMLALALKRAGLSFPKRQGGFHLFCHTYGTCHYGGLDTFGLVRTNR